MDMFLLYHETDLVWTSVVYSLSISIKITVHPYLGVPVTAMHFHDSIGLKLSKTRQRSPYPICYKTSLELVAEHALEYKEFEGSVQVQMKIQNQLLRTQCKYSRNRKRCFETFILTKLALYQMLLRHQVRAQSGL